MNSRRLFAATAAAAMVGSALIGAAPANASASDNTAASASYSRVKTVHTSAKLRQLNKSGVSGKAHVTVKGNNLNVTLDASGLHKAPHAVHIHYGEQARNECPTLRDDTNKDRRLTTLEGVPAYGPVAVSLTTKGDTSPASALAIDRFKTAPTARSTTTGTTSGPTRASRRASVTATPSWWCTASTTTTTASTTSAPARATSTPNCRPRPPTRPPAASCAADRSGLAPASARSGALRRAA
jgi:hypothetical protein